MISRPPPHGSSSAPAQAVVELAATRVMYQTLPTREYPQHRGRCPRLYGLLEEQFAYGLDRLLDGLGITRDVPSLPLSPYQPGRQPPAAHGDGDAVRK
jgi:hypothetical protein